MLEDMHVQAIKAGPLYTTDAVRVLAQIAADYPDVPLLLQLHTPPQALQSDDF
ncbi:MAG TPA: hydroxymethylpyrimidine/phosphomethylpyrimidine kinase, partial [Pusillimonas sp.]|nr:hydroxymethylpyrimidine/phosphomethylpyrimidine kinase [Pusillimonas sp.]